MDAEVLRNYRKAGRIAREARDYGAKLIKPGVSYLEVVNKTEEKIKKLGGSLACPVTIGINEVAAHDTADTNDERVFKEGDLVKIDLGVHVNGWIADTGLSIDLGGHEKIIKTCEESLSNAIKVLKPGLQVREVGKAIHDTAREKGFNPIVNLSGHSVNRFELHAGLTTPNYDNKSTRALPNGVVVAIEPFITKGVGRVVDAGKPLIYQLNHVKPVRLRGEREIIKLARERFNGLPFSKRWVSHVKGHELMINRLVNQGILVAYHPLKEVSGEVVAYKEHTVIIKQEPEVITK